MNNMKRLAILIAVLLSLPSFAAAQRRRSSGMDAGSGAAATVGCQGIVTDAVTGRPIPFALITTGKLRFYTGRLGMFALNAVTAPGGEVEVTASRTGYQSSTIRISGAGTPCSDVSFRLTSRPAATLRKTDGTTVEIDDDSVIFGFVVPFMSYQTATGNYFCTTAGTRTNIPMGQIKRITGLGTSVPTSCCQRAGQRVLLELRDGTIQDATFVDSCYGYTVDLIARDRATNDYIYLPFGQVSEIVFP